MVKMDVESGKHLINNLVPNHSNNDNSNNIQKLNTNSSCVLKDNGYIVILARALLLFLLTFDLFLNAYVIMSLDRYNLMIGTFTIITSAIGQFSAITGQFGYPIGDLLLKIFILCDIILITGSLLFDQFEQNFMTEISFVFTLTGFITGCFILLKSRQ